MTATIAVSLPVPRHCRIVGRPGRAGGLIKFLDYVQSKTGVWLARRIDIARHWNTVHPPQPQPTSPGTSATAAPRSKY